MVYCRKGRHSEGLLDRVRYIPPEYLCRGRKIRETGVDSVADKDKLKLRLIFSGAFLTRFLRRPSLLTFFPPCGTWVSESRQLDQRFFPLRNTTGHGRDYLTWFYDSFNKCYSFHLPSWPDLAITNTYPTSRTWTNQSDFLIVLRSFKIYRYTYSEIVYFTLAFLFFFSSTKLVYVGRDSVPVIWTR